MLSSSQALNAIRELAIPFLIVNALVAAGCTGSGMGVIDLDDAVVGEQGKAIDEFNLGIIFADERSYVCLPLSWIGLDSFASITEVSSSCHCAVPTLVFYESLEGQADAIRIDFVPDNSSAISRRPASLSIEISLSLANGDRRKILLSLLQTNSMGMSSG